MRRGARDSGGNRGNGGKWIRTEKRRRIYERDGWRCVWCTCRVTTASANAIARGIAAITVGHERDLIAVACLDHVLPRESGGSNHESNLVTSCMSCNAARGDNSAIEFAYAHFAPYDILDRVITAMGTPLEPAKRRAA